MGGSLFRAIEISPKYARILLSSAQHGGYPVIPAQIPNRLIRTQMTARRRVRIVGNQHIFILHREERPFHMLIIEITDHIQRVRAIVPFVGKNARVLRAKQFIPTILHHRRFLSQRDQPLVIAVYRARLTNLLLSVDLPVIRIDSYPGVSRCEPGVGPGGPLHGGAGVVPPFRA